MPNQKQKDLHRQSQGYLNRQQGANFEKYIENSLWYCRNIAELDKTPEPIKLISTPNYKGQFQACFIKKAQPDYKGTILGGRSMIFEAKHTTTDRLLQGVVTEEQAQKLEKHHTLGAICFIIVGFNMRHFFRVPWVIWQDMKQHYGHKYVTPDDLIPYQLKTGRRGELLILEHILEDYPDIKPIDPRED